MEIGAKAPLGFGLIVSHTTKSRLTDNGRQLN